MTPHDKAIRDAIAQDESTFLRTIEEPPISDQIIATFQGRQRWMVVLGFLFSIAFLALMVVAAMEFFRAETVREMIAWASVFGIGVISTGLMKIWYFLELNKYVVMREIKRLELQVARVSEAVMKRTEGS